MIRPILAVLVAGVLAACGDEDALQILVFQATPDAIEAGQSTTLVFAVQPSTATLAISAVGDVTGRTEMAVAPPFSTSYQLIAAHHGAIADRTVRVTVGATSAAAIRLEPATATPTAGEPLPVVVTVVAADGNPAPGFRGTLRVASTDAGAALPADLAFTAAEAGVQHATVTLEAAGLATLTATDLTGKAHASGSASLTVRPAAARSYALGALPASAIAGQALALTITARDAFGNLATDYHGAVHVASPDRSDVLPPDGALIAGVRTVSLAFVAAGNHVVQVQDPALVLAAATSSSVAVGP